MAELGMAPSANQVAPGALAAGGWRWLLSPADGYWRPTAAVARTLAAGRLIGTVTPRGEGGAERLAVRAPGPGELLVLVDHLATRRLAPLAALWAPMSTND
jgi:predicted deacylase